MKNIDKSSSVHLPTQLADMLRDAIRNGDFQNGHAIPSERELAERHGLSRTTVRQAIDLLVHERLLRRVPGSGTFVGSKDDRLSVHPTLGLIVPSLANPGYGALADAIEREASARGFHLVVGQSKYSGNNEASYLAQYAENAAVEGAIVVASGDAPPVTAYRYLMERGTPFVFALRAAIGVGADAVTSDLVRGTHDIARYLIGLGHRRIAYIGGERAQPDPHLPGYRQALDDAGISANPNLIIMPQSNDEAAGREGIEHLLQRHISFTAIIARIDMTAIGAIKALRDAGLRVPEDISVAGYDNTPISAHFQPPITTVDNTIREIGRLAMTLLMDRVEGRYGGPSRRVTIQPELVIRTSCDVPSQAELYPLSTVGPLATIAQ